MLLARLHWSVRAKLLAFACIVLAPVAVVAYATGQSYVGATRAQILSSSAATANVAVASVDDFLTTAERMMLVLASTDAVQSGDRAAVEDLFAQTLRLSPEYLSLYVIDADGRIAVHSPGDPATGHGMRFGEEALRTGTTTISGRLGDPTRLTAALAVPIRREAQTGGTALGVEFALERLQRNIADAVMREHAVVIVLDSAAQVLVAPESRLYAEDIQWMSVPIVQSALRGEQGAAEYRNPLDGTQWLGAYAPIRRAGWAVIVSYPADEVFAPLRAATLTAAVSLAAVLLFALALAYWLAARFTRPLREVRHVALSIAQGNYDRRVPYRAGSRDEVGELAAAFNQMAQALHDHLLALDRAQHEIEQKAAALQKLLERSVAVQEAERKRIAQDIHDGITQMLVGSIYEMQAARQALAHPGANGAAEEKIGNALRLVSESVSEIRRVIFDLHPTVLDELGLVPALKRLAEAMGTPSLECSYQAEGTPVRLPVEQELALYRIAQEALSNVRQHAGARHARISLRFEPECIVMEVSDDGRGMQRPLDSGEQLGLIGMRERAQSVGGRFELASERDSGTHIMVTIPR